MNTAPLRLTALREYDVMDSAKEDAFDDLTLLTSRICGTPIALITLLDTQRQWFKSVFGLSVSETPLDQAFCSHAIEQKKVFTVTDARLDARFASNPLVTGDPGIRFYAGAPLITPDGVALGTLCAIDRVPRVLSPMQLDSLAALSRQAVQLLEQRKTLKVLRNALIEKFEADAEVARLKSLLPKRA